MHPLSLEQLTIMDVTPPELVSIAAALGCQAISLYVEPPGGGIEVYPLIDDTPIRRETVARLAGTGVTVHNLEAYVLAPDTRVENYRSSLEAGARMGAKTATAIVFDSDRNRVCDQFAQLCVCGAEFGLRINAEFFAGSELKSFRDAVRLVTDAGQRNAGIVVDSLHVVRTGSSLADVAAADPRLIGNAQICDGPRVMAPDQQMFEAKDQRLIPGEGEFPLREFVEALPPDLMIGVEVPMKNLETRGVPAAERARMAVEATRRILTAAAR
jgi:sugar phosphate isomerase/epimerase